LLLGRAQAVHSNSSLVENKLRILIAFVIGLKSELEKLIPGQKKCKIKARNSGLPLKLELNLLLRHFICFGTFLALYNLEAYLISLVDSDIRH
jgi:hypothetical protein